MEYKQAIRIFRAQGDSYVSNELNDLLLSIDMTGFLHTRNCNIGSSKMSPVINVRTDHPEIAQKFAMYAFRGSAQ